MAILNIASVDMLAPIEGGYTVEAYDADSAETGHTETFELVRDRIYTNAYKIKYTTIGTGTQIKVITDAIAAATFTVVFWNPILMTTTTKTMYAGDRSAEMIKLGTAATTYWKFTVNLIDTCA